MKGGGAPAAPGGGSIQPPPERCRPPGPRTRRGRSCCGAGTLSGFVYDRGHHFKGEDIGPQGRTHPWDRRRRRGWRSLSCRFNGPDIGVLRAIAETPSQGGTVRRAEMAAWEWASPPTGTVGDALHTGGPGIIQPATATGRAGRKGPLRVWCCGRPFIAQGGRTGCHARE